MLSQYVQQGASFSGDIDHLIWLITVIVGVWFLIAEGVLFWLIMKFNAKGHPRAKYITGELASEKRWVSWPHYAVLVFDVIIIVSAINVWKVVKIDMPTQPDETVRVIAQQWAWVFVHPGPDGKLDTADDLRTVDELHVVKDRTYVFELQSRDVLHSFSVPVFRLKQDAIPGRTIKGWFKPTLTGSFDIQCTEICGIGHGLMPARIIVEEPEAHAAWMKATPPMMAAAAPTPEKPAAPAPAPAPGGMP